VAGQRSGGCHSTFETFEVEWVARRPTAQEQGELGEPHRYLDVAPTRLQGITATTGRQHLNFLSFSIYLPGGFDGGTGCGTPIGQHQTRRGPPQHIFAANRESQYSNDFCKSLLRIRDILVQIRIRIRIRSSE
jgi:hypothetical protein